MPNSPDSTIAWLTDRANPVVTVLARRDLLGAMDSPELTGLWAERNQYQPIAAILDAMRPDGSWTTPGQDYRKYGGNLWQVHFLGELHANGNDDRVRHAAEYAFSRQLPDGSWSAANKRAAGSIPCLTANVGRALARLGFARDDRVIAGLAHCVDLYRELGCPNCRQGVGAQLNGYCHMLVPKLLLFLAEVPRDAWPEGADELRDACITALREKRVFHCLPKESREFQEALYSMPVAERRGYRERFLAENPELHYGVKPGWLRFGFPLSYNSDALEALHALALHDEPAHPEYADALDVLRSARTDDGRWLLRTTLNGKMLADVEVKREPSRWLTWRALSVLQHFGAQ